VFTDASKGLVSNAITGTGSVVMSASPTLTGTITAAAANFSGAVALNGNATIGDADTDTITPAASYVTGTQLKSAKTDTNTLSLAAYDVDGTAYTNLITLTASNTPTLALTSTGVGTINNMSIGATTASTGAFTTLASNGAVTFTAGTASTTAGTGTLVITGGLGVSGRINAANFDGIVGANTAAAGSFTTLSATGDISTTSTGRLNVRGAATAINYDLQIDNSDTLVIFRGSRTNAVTKGYGWLLNNSTTEGMRLDSSGNLGIGTTGQVSRISSTGSSATDFKALTLRNSNGTVGSAAVLNFEASAGAEGDAASTAAQIKGIREAAGTNGALAFWTSLSGTSAERARIDSNGNFGIGTTAPATKLHIFQRSDAGAAPNTPEIRIEHQDINAIGTGGSNGGVLSFVNIQRDNTGWASNAIWGRINFSPSQPTSGTAQLGASILAAADGAISGQQSASYLAFYTSDYTNGGNTGEKMRISAEGVLNVGLTTGASGDGKLIVAATGTGAGTTNTRLFMAGYELTSGNAAGLWFGARNNENTGVIGSRTATGNIAFETYNGGWGERARITYVGNVLVNTTSNIFGSRLAVVGAYPQVAGSFETNNSTYAAIFCYASQGNYPADQIAFYANVSSVATLAGKITCTTSTVSYGIGSDYRLKNNITPMTGALAKVALLKPVAFKWNVDGSDGEGFIAHELQAVMPIAVAGEKDEIDENGKPRHQTVDTSFLVATLTAAIQEQQALIQQLTARLDAANL
jgi:hypothetical protein